MIKCGSAVAHDPLWLGSTLDKLLLSSTFMYRPKQAATHTRKQHVSRGRHQTNRKSSKPGREQSIRVLVRVGRGPDV